MTAHSSLLRWALGGLFVLTVLVLSISFVDYTDLSPVQVVSETVWALVPASFAAAAGVIIARQPGNSIGWILLVPASMGLLDPLLIQPLQDLDSAPAVDLGLLVQLWVDNFLWVFLVFPIFHLLLVFPTGRVLSPRWRWVVRLEIAMAAFITTTGLLVDRLGTFDFSGSARWTVDNPIGLIPEDFFDNPVFGLLWTTGLVILTIGGGLAMYLRHRRGSPVEKRQIRLVVLSVGIFVAIYVPIALVESFVERGLVDTAFAISFHLIPIAIVASVLRYRLFDIDILIRRTVLYAVVLALLAVAYFGLITALSTVLPSRDPLLVAMSTLAVAALFNPLRRRVQRLLDRRFDRSRYDLELTLESFVGYLGSATDPDALIQSWVEVVNQAMHPRATAVWVRHPR